MPTLLSSLYLFLYLILFKHNLRAFYLLVFVIMKAQNVNEVKPLCLRYLKPFFFYFNSLKTYIFFIKYNFFFS